MISSTGDTENSYLYCAEQLDSTTGLYYLRARYMNPSTGTFISMDTYQGSIFEPATLHKYLYANANPVMYTDPSGYSAENDIDFYQQAWITVEQASEYETKLICNMHNEVSYDFQVMKIGREILHQLKNTGLEYALTYVLEPYVGPNVARLIANGAVSGSEIIFSSRNKNVNNTVDKLKRMINDGDKKDGKNIVFDLSDNSKIIFRLDTGNNAHKIPPKYLNPVDHINIEIQYVTPNRNNRTLLDVHIILDSNGNIADVIFTGDRSK